VVIGKLEDMENNSTFIACDPEKKLLAVQVAMEPGGVWPRGWLKRMDGKRLALEFEKRENTLWAQVSDLEPGEYEIVLER
jgi:hypothetical protein